MNRGCPRIQLCGQRIYPRMHVINRKRRKLQRLVAALNQQIEMNIGGLKAFVSHNPMDFHPRMSDEQQLQIQIYGKLWHNAYGPNTSREIMQTYRREFRATKYLNRIEVHIYRNALDTCQRTGYITGKLYRKLRRYLCTRNTAGCFLSPGFGY